jgi:hypothetical protein
MRVGVRHQLVGFLAGGVQAHRVVDGIVDRERDLGVGAVDRRRAGVDEVLDAVVAAAFEQVGEADDVGLHVGVRILQRVAHAGLRGEVDDGIEVALLEQVLHHHAVGDVVLEEAEVGVGFQLFQPREFERRVVVVVEVVDADDLVAAGEQDLRDVHADKAGGTGNEYFHAVSMGTGRILTWPGRPHPLRMRAWRSSTKSWFTFCCCGCICCLWIPLRLFCAWPARSAATGATCPSASARVQRLPGIRSGFMPSRWARRAPPHRWWNVFWRKENPCSSPA